MTVVIHGRAAIRPEMLEEARSAAVRMGEASRTEPGCNEYRFATDLADPAVMILAEDLDRGDRHRVGGDAADGIRALRL